MPPGEDFGAGYHVIAQVQLRLEQQFDLRIKVRIAQCLFDLEPLGKSARMFVVKGDNAVLAAALGVEQREVGAFEYGGLVLAMVDPAASDGAGNLDKAAFDQIGLPQPREQPFHPRDHFGLAQIFGDHDPEFIAANAADMRAGDAECLEPLADRFEQFVAHHMAVIIIDRLKAIKVEQRQPRAVFALGLFAHGGEKRAAVGKPGKHIGERLFAVLFTRVLLLIEVTLGVQQRIYRKVFGFLRRHNRAPQIVRNSRPGGSSGEAQESKDKTLLRGEGIELESQQPQRDAGPHRRLNKHRARQREHDGRDDEVDEL